MTTPPKLYAVIGPVRYGFVTDESGAVIYSHISSSQEWARRDLSAGIKRLNRFPDGYEVVYIERFADAPQSVTAAFVARGLSS
jgi:hypothetical protein